MNNAKIIGVGHYAPPNIWTNHDLEQMMDTTDAWIRKRTGIEQRHMAEPGVGSSDLGYEAAVRAIADAGLEPDDIDLIVFSTLSPDYYFPGNGVLLQKKLGISEIGAIDVRQQCSGFVYALSIANAYIKSGEYRNVLVTAAELQHSFLEFTTEGRNTSVIFGDAAGAVVVAPTEQDGILSTHLHSQGEFAEMLYIEAPSPKREPYISHQDIDDSRHRLVMEGAAVFKHAVRRFVECINESLAANGKHLDDVDLFVLHQANIRISNAVADQMGIPAEKVFNNIQKYGNTSSATIPICLSEAKASGKLSSGDLVCAAAFGSGFTWASALMKW